MMRETVSHSVGSHPSLPKTLLPTTMGFGRMGTAAIKDVIRHSVSSSLSSLKLPTRSRELRTERNRLRNALIAKRFHSSRK